jgi:hypothetical protein
LAGLKHLRAREIATRPCEASDESLGDEINTGLIDNDRNGLSFAQKVCCRSEAWGPQQVDLESHQVDGGGAKLIGRLTPPILDN